MGDINKMEEECTHNCMTCGHAVQKAVMVWGNSKKP